MLVKFWITKPWYCEDKSLINSKIIPKYNGEKNVNIYGIWLKTKWSR